MGRKSIIMFSVCSKNVQVIISKAVKIESLYIPDSFSIRREK